MQKIKFPCNNFLFAVNMKLHLSDETSFSAIAIQRSSNQIWSYIPYFIPYLQ